jgi:site-specific DNA-methyltransferase (adenine-specific)
MTELCTLPIDNLRSHPDNPRLGLRTDVVERLASEMGRHGFGRQHAITVRPHGDVHQIICGHHRVEAARQCGLTEVPAWAVDMSDDEAFMQLVLGNTQGELSKLERAVHVYRAGQRGELGAGRGKKGGLSEYARRIDGKQQRVNEQFAVGELLENYRTSGNFSALVEADPYSQLLEVSKAPREAWPTLVSALVTGGWTVADTTHHVGNVRAFEIPESERHWLPLDSVMRRHLETREFSAKTVARLLTAADQTREWIATNGDDKMATAFEQWLTDNAEGESWQPRAIAGYHQRLIASQYVVEGWHHGDWREHVNSLDDRSVALLLTDPPYGVDYQSDYRLDRRKDRKHEHIAADDIDAPVELAAMLEVFDRKLAADAHVLVFCNWGREPEMRDTIIKAGYVLRGSLIWDKQATGMGDPITTFAPAHERILHAVKGSPPLYERAPDVLRHRRCDSTRHPTEKPESLLAELITATTVEGQVVADPFGGVASTPAAAKACGRAFFGCELYETYWKAGEERLLA